MFLHHFLPGLVFSALLLTCSTPSRAQLSLSLPEAQRIALVRSQQLVAHDAAAAAVREMAVAAGQMPDPVLRLGIDNLPVNGPDRFSLTRDFMTMRRIGVMQEITRADKRQLKVERVERDGQRVVAERQLALTGIQRETALAWLERYYAQQMVGLFRRQVDEARLQIQGAEIAFRGGRGSQADVFGGRAALANLEDRLRQSERQARSAGLMLARWVGPDAAAQPLAGPVDWRESAQAELLGSGQLAHLPHVAALDAQVGMAETEVRQAQANTRADWTVEAMYSQRGPAFSNMVSLGVSIPLQLDRANRQDREVAARQAALAEARARLEDALAEQDAQGRVLVNDWTAGKERFDRLATDLLPAVRQRAEAALTAYRTGKGDLVSVLAARRDEIDAHMQILTVEMDTARLWAQLNYLVPDAGATGARKEQR